MTKYLLSLIFTYFISGISIAQSREVLLEIGIVSIALGDKYNGSKELKKLSDNTYENEYKVKDHRYITSVLEFYNLEKKLTYVSFNVRNSEESKKYFVSLVKKHFGEPESDTNDDFTDYIHFDKNLQRVSIVIHSGEYQSISGNVVVQAQLPFIFVKEDKFTKTKSFRLMGTYAQVKSSSEKYFDVHFEGVKTPEKEEFLMVLGNQIDDFDKFSTLLIRCDEKVIEIAIKESKRMDDINAKDRKVHVATINVDLISQILDSKDVEIRIKNEKVNFDFDFNEYLRGGLQTFYNFIITEKY